MDNQIDEQLLTRKHLADIISISERTIQRWEVEGMPVIKINRLRRYKYSDVTNWIFNQQKEARK